jgi:hypothetical protein
MLHKIAATKLYGVRIEQWFFALAASGLSVQLGGRYAIDTIAVRANDVQRITHGLFLLDCGFEDMGTHPENSKPPERWPDWAMAMGNFI